MTVIKTKILTEQIAANTAERCYYCKRELFSAISKQACRDGFDTVVDGTNASDSAEDRPGMRVLKEFGILSPLKECGLTKSDIRKLSNEAGLFTWEKPAYACLATRIKTGEEITKEKLAATEHAEDFLSSLEFKDFRVRNDGGAAKIQIHGSELGRIIEEREKIVRELRQFYKAVVLDLEMRE